MKKRMYLFLLLSTLTNCGITQEIEFSPSDWENPAVFEKGQNQPHSFHVPYDSKETALENIPAQCENYQLLNGNWKFKWVERPEEVPNGFWQPDYGTEGWNEIVVPSNWQMEGYGHPKFRNVSLSYESDPPFIPDYYNPVGCYKRMIKVPENWNNKEIMLRFEGVKSAAYIWVNGKRVGYNQGGFEPAEFNITPFIKIGENDLSVQVLRFCDGSYLENQDMWRLSGIYRDVKLYAQPKTYIHDHFIVTDLDENYEHARLKVETEIYNQNDFSTQVSLEIQLWDENENQIFEEEVSDVAVLGQKAHHTLRLSAFIKNPHKWSAEKPYLYTILFELKDDEGNPIEAFTQKIGFREVEYNQKILSINGVPIKLNGINSHMHHPDKGQTVPLEVLRADLEIMKRNNINCARTCHYPPTPEYLAMADEIGIYIVDEVGDEAHSNLQLSQDSSWTEMYKDRSEKLVYRDRNHPSVIMWSAGNESGSGFNIDEVIKIGKQIDPSRPAWMYGGNTFYIPFEDIVGPRYWLPLWLRSLVKGQILPTDDLRSSFMDEYLAATGNGLGGLDEYWEIIRENERSMGGAIWDYVSPGITTPRWILTDRSSSENHGQIMGRPIFTEGKNGRGLKFSGHDDWVEFYRDPSLDITGKEISIGFWVKPYEIPQPNLFIAKGKYQYGVQMSDPATLQFYIHTNERRFLSVNSSKISVETKVDQNFYDSWHFIAGIYDGQKLTLYLDNEIVAETEFDGEMMSTPFPLCLGRESETQDQGEYAGRMSSMVLDDVRIFDRAVSLDKLKSNDQSAVLSLDFESDTKDGSFYAIGLGGRTYGVIWPDRRIQPEMHQIKKSGQPIGFKLIDKVKGLVRISNFHHFTNLEELDGSWTLKIDGKEIKKGEIHLNIPPGERGEFTIPVQEINIPGEKILLLSYSLKTDPSWANEKHEVAWEEFIWPAVEPRMMENASKGSLSVEERDMDLYINGAHFTYQLDKTNGQLKSMRYKDYEYLNSGPEFSIWRAPLANDVDPWGSYKYYSNNVTKGYGRSIDNQIRTLGLRDMTSQVDRVEVLKVDSASVIIEIDAWSMSSLSVSAVQDWGNTFSAFQRKEIWKILADGTIELEQEIKPHGVMPELLPREGLEFLLPKSFEHVEWYGRGPFETYPDRKTGAKIGIYSSNADEMYEPYIFPQDYGNRTDVRWLKVSNKQGKGLLIQGDHLLNFSLHKYSTDNLSRAVYSYQLEESPNMILNVDYRVSGVGGTALRQLEAYRNKAQLGTFKLSIKPY